MDAQEQNSNSHNNNSDGPCQRCWACSNKVQIFFEKLFGGLGSIIARFPFITIAICIIIVGTCAVGFMFFKSEDRVEKLYIPPGSKSLEDLAKANKLFPLLDTRTETIIITSKTGSNAVTQQCFGELLKLHKAIVALKDFDKYCKKLSNKCVFTSPLELFDFDENKIENITRTVTAWHSSPLYVMRNGRPMVMNFGRMFGKPVWSGHVFQSAAAVQVDYLISNREEEDKEVLKLEKKLIDTVFDMKTSFSCAEVFLSSERSLSDATSESSGSDIVLISITFTLMITFTCCSMIKFKNPLTGHALLANVGILTVGLGIGAGLGLSMFIGTPFISIVGILPFLILGIGIDDIFIIIDELDRIDVSKNSVVDNVRLVMAHSGASITMTTLTDLVAFAVSTLTQFPSIRHFCIYAALSITFVYLMVVTMFVAFLSLDVRRMKAGRRDFLPFCTVPEKNESQQPWTSPYQHISSKLMQFWGRFLMHPITRAFVVIISLALLGVSIFYALKISEDFDRRMLAKKDSYILKFLDIQDKYYPNTVPVSIVIDTKTDYGSAQVQQDILKLSTIATSNSYYTNRTVSWLESFLSFSQKANLSVVGPSFVSSLNTFLDTPQFSYFKQDLVFSEDNSSLDASRILCFIDDTLSSVKLKEAMLTLRADLASKSEISTYPIAKIYIYLEQYARTMAETTLNVGIAGAAVFVIMLPFLGLTVTLIVTCGFGALICELFALMYLWDVSLNMISTINLVMAIGFSVDYSAHVAHAYLVSPKHTPEERAIHALSTTGASVLMGGTSTFLGMVVTGFASSEIFTIFFKMFVGIVVLGLVHGLCFLPVYLSLLYRWAPVSLQKPSNSFKQTVGITNQLPIYESNVELNAVDNSSDKQDLPNEQVAAENSLNKKVQPIFSFQNGEEIH